jgi:hypothetical protein
MVAVELECSKKQPKRGSYILGAATNYPGARESSSPVRRPSSSNCAPGHLHSLRGLSTWNAVQPANYYVTLLLVFYWCCCDLRGNAVLSEFSGNR